VPQDDGFTPDRPAGSVTRPESDEAPAALPSVSSGFVAGTIPAQRPPADALVPPPAWAPPPQPTPRRARLWPVLSALLVVSMLLALGGAALAYVALRGGDEPPAVTAWVDMRPATRDAALSALLDRREKAVKAKDEAAFLADVDPDDPAVVKREKQLFENLTRIPFAAFHFELEPYRRDVQGFLTRQVRDRFHQAAFVGAVTIQYQIAGIDTKPVAAPWLPVFVFDQGRWRVGAEVTDKDLPFGANGQAWDAAGPIVVVTGPRVVAVLSADDAERGAFLLDLAEKGLDKVARTRPGGWDGKVFVTAVQDQRIFDTYFSDSPERVAQVAAIAVPYYNRVPDWGAAPAYATTRIVFNPQELSAQPDELAHDLTHEFTHAAMGPVTSGATPRWLVEGFAEYAAYNGTNVSAAYIKKALGDLDVAHGFPADDKFYAEPRNYVGAWLACRMIAEKYSPAGLIKLYEAFQHTTDVAAAVRSTLGVAGVTELEAQWQRYVDALR
jgi:hypothetical protein